MKAEDVRTKILRDLDQREPHSDFQDMAINMLADARAEYDTAKEMELAVEREVDKQHWRKQRDKAADKILKWSKILHLDKKGKPNKKKVGDYFAVKRGKTA